ncbi:hypothetical protein WA158_008155 [Blastocystis sp. Blastoise]
MDTFPDSFEMPPRVQKRAFPAAFLETLKCEIQPIHPKSWEGLFDSCKDITLPQGTFRVYFAGNRGPRVLCLHGCGLSALSFAAFANECKNFCQIIAPDFRGHGNSHSTNDIDFSLKTLSNDTKDIVENIIGDDLETPLVVLGHSMGGAIACEYCHIETKYPIKGLLVLDVVEQTAIDALSHMNMVIMRKPKTFSSLESAIAWSFNSGTLQNRDSACISIPDQLKQEGDHYVWKVDLTKSEPYWKDWYTGMNKKFLSAPGYKLLAVAGRDRLDKELTIAQMQGKFQMVVLNGLGHHLHEDNPREMSHVLQRYLWRYKFISEELEKELVKEKLLNEYYNL